MMYPTDRPEEDAVARESQTDDQDLNDDLDEDDDELDNDTDGATGNDTDGGSGDDDGDDEETVEDLKARVARMERALRKANREAQKTRTNGKAKPKPADKDDAEADDDAEQATDERMKRAVVGRAARAALVEAGFTGGKDQAKRLVRMLDLEGVDLDEDGDFEGLDDAVEELKEDFPLLFAEQEAGDTGKPNGRRRPAGISPAGKSTKGSKTAKTTTQLQAEAYFGKKARA